MSSDKSQVWIWVETEWKCFYAQQKVSEMTDAAVKAYEILLKNKKEGL
jgi:hypothetical protein